MSDDQLHSLEQLNLKMGQVLQLHPTPGDNNTRYDCTLIGGLPGETIIITAPASGRFPALKEGSVVAIRVMSAIGVAMFPTVVLCIIEEPLYMVFLDFPKSIKFKMIRTSTRVNVALPALLTNLTQPSHVTVAGRVQDISLTGALIEADKDVGNKGDTVELKGKFEVGKIRRIANIHAVVRMKKKLSNGNYHFGIEFDESDEEKLLVLFGYIFNAMAEGQAKIIQ